MPPPLMPKATAVWLVENSVLTFQQIADFCGLHALEVQAIADGEAGTGIIGLDPVAKRPTCQGRARTLQCRPECAPRTGQAARTAQDQEARRALHAGL